MNNLRERIYTIIFETDTPAGKAFDVGLIVCILFSVLLVMLDTA
jgi:voltage-gated potassium channel